MADPMNPQQFAARVRQRYPGAYDDLADDVLTQKVLAKYPEYKDMVATAPPEQPKPDNSTWNGIKSFAEEINPVSMVTGLRDLAAHPVDSLNQAGENMVKRWKAGYQQVKQGDIAGGSANMLYGSIPFVGEAIGRKGDLASQGRYAESIGGSIGLGLNLAAPGAVKNVKLPAAVKQGAANLSERIYQSQLKPSGAYTQAEANAMAKTALKNEIPISAEGLSKLDGLVREYDSAVKDSIATGNKAGATVNKFDVTRRLGDTARKFEQQAAPTADLEAIGRVGNDFLGTKPGLIPAQDAQAIKSGTYQRLKARAYGEVGSATTEAEKALARGIKEELETQFPEIKGLNAKQGELIKLDEALEKAVARTQKHDLFSLGGKVATGAGATAGSSMGVTGAAGGSMAALILHHVMSDATVQSRLAIAINRSMGGGKLLPASRTAARLSAYSQALGRVADSQDNGQEGKP